MRLAVVGCGGVCQHHLSAIAASTSMKVTAVVDVDAAAAAAAAAHTTGAAIFTSLHALAAARPTFDAVALFLPHHLHRPHAEFVLGELPGKHLVLEKPLAPSVQDCRAVLHAARRAADAHGTRFFVAENSPYWPTPAEVLRRVQAGDVGDVVTVDAHYFEVVSNTEFVADDGADAVDAWMSWRSSAELAGGGVLSDGGLHWLRPLRLLMEPTHGRVQRATGFVDRIMADMEGESIARAALQFESGRCASLSATVMATGRFPPPLPWMTVLGTQGSLTVHSSFDGGATLFSDGGPATGEPLVFDGPSGYFASFPPMWADIEQYFATGAPPRSQPEEAFADVAIVQAVYAAATHRRAADVEVL